MADAVMKSVKRANGVMYELLSVKVLRENGFTVDHCGRVGDKGVDFKGHWTLPQPLSEEVQRVSIIGQCKNHRRKCSPCHVRELEGTLLRQTESDRVIGMLVTSAGFTPGTVVYCQLSSLPLILCQLIPSTHEHLVDGYISKVIFSRATATLCECNNTVKYKLSNNNLKEINFIK